MAKFSQEFLRQMASPTYGQGLFTAARQAGQLPAQLQQQQMQQQQMQALRSMTPMQRAQVAMQTAKTPSQINAAQAQMDAAQKNIAAGKQEEAVAELNKLYQQYITETDPTKQRKLLMSSLKHSLISTYRKIKRKSIVVLLRRRY